MKSGTLSRPGDRRRTSAGDSGKISTGKKRGKETELRTNWEKFLSMSDEEVAASIAKDPDIVPTDAEFWRGAKVIFPKPKKMVTMRLDADLLDWFRSRPGYQTRINSILRYYMDAQTRRR